MRSRTIGAVFISLFGAVFAAVSAFFLNSFCQNERLFDGEEVANEALPSDDKAFLISEGISLDNTPSNVIKRITYKEIRLSLGPERRDLYTLFGTLIKDYSDDPGDDEEYTCDAYCFCSQFPNK